jgi:Zn-dependent protease with chaperone function
MLPDICYGAIAMTNEQFDALVTRLEGDAKRDPARYRFKVFLLALLGYGYVFFILAALLALVLLIVGALLAARRAESPAIRLVFPFLALAYLIVRALWVRLPPPEGLALTAARAPALFREIAEIRRALKGPHAHAVLLNDEFNAGIVQIPRLGLFGWQKNFLLVGLPMMQALSPEQFRAVLAHEFGHLSGAHGRVGAWIYRVRKTWYQLMERLEREQHWGTFIFARFFQWDTPFFGAYSFVLARGQEFEADRCSAELVGARQAADALIATSTAGAFLAEDFWPRLYAAADHCADPPADPYDELQRAFRIGIEPEHTRRWVEQAIAGEDRQSRRPSCAVRSARRVGTAVARPYAIGRDGGVGAARAGARRSAPAARPGVACTHRRALAQALRRGPGRPAPAE